MGPNLTGSVEPDVDPGKLKWPPQNKLRNVIFG